MKKGIGIFMGLIFICFLVIIALNEKTDTVSTVPTKPLITTTNETQVSLNKRRLPNDTEKVKVSSTIITYDNGEVEPIGPFYFSWNWKRISTYEIIDTSKIMVDGNGDMFIYGKDAAPIIEEEEKKIEQERQQYEDNKNDIKPLFE